MTLRPYLLALCALGLAGLVAWDYWPHTPPVSLVPAPQTQLAEVRDLNPISQRQMGAFQALFDHPLFDPTRSPPALAVAVPEALAVYQPIAVVVAEPILPPKPVLRGTVTSPAPGGAYLGDDLGGTVVFLRPGQTAQGLTLSEVFDTRAVFQGPDGPITLPLQETAPLAEPAEPNLTPTSSATLPAP